jgi:hypothetical protein
MPGLQLTSLTKAQGSNNYATPKGAWSSATAYAANAVVTYSGGTYRAVAASTNVTPGTDGTKWESWGGAGGGAAINDAAASTSSVYSSTKTNAAIAAAVAALVNSSPAALDTLKELADAINDDANFAATITTALAGKASVDGSGHVPLATLPVGASFTITSPDGGTTWTDKAGTTITVRPSSRTDLVMVCETTGSTLPSFAITGDYLAKIA